MCEGSLVGLLWTLVCVGCCGRAVESWSECSLASMGQCVQPAGHDDLSKPGWHQDCHALFHGTDAHTANFHHGAFHFTKVIRLDAGMSTEATQPQFRNHRQQRKDGIMKRTSNHTRLSYNSLKIFNLTLVALCQKSWSKPQDQPSATAGLLLPLFRDVSPHSCRLWCDQLHHNRAEQGPTTHDISSPGSSRD